LVIALPFDHFDDTFDDKVHFLACRALLEDNLAWRQVAHDGNLYQTLDDLRVRFLKKELAQQFSIGRHRLSFPNLLFAVNAQSALYSLRRRFLALACSD
jgi:hypothetical protein